MTDDTIVDPADESWVRLSPDRRHRDFPRIDHRFVDTGVDAPTGHGLLARWAAGRLRIVFLDRDGPALMCALAPDQAVALARSIRRARTDPTPVDPPGMFGPELPWLGVRAVAIDDMVVAIECCFPDGARASVVVPVEDADAVATLAETGA